MASNVPNQPAACYDNPIFNDEASPPKGYPAQNGKAPAGDYEGYEEGALSTPGGGKSAHDYMHSLPGGIQGEGLSFRGTTRRRRRLMCVALVIAVAILAAIAIGLIVHFLESSSKSPNVPSTTTPLPAQQTTTAPGEYVTGVRGQMTIVSGPFSTYKDDYNNPLTDAFTIFRDNFVFWMDRAFSSSPDGSVYNRTRVTEVSNNNGRPEVNFDIYLQPGAVLTAAEVRQQLGPLIVRGLQDSSLGIEKDGLKLKVNVIPVEPTEFPRQGECLPITLKYCVNQTAYQMTSYPNVLGHTSNKETELMMDGNFSHVFGTNCVANAADFYCSILAPECSPATGEHIPPCRRYCQDVKESCDPVSAPSVPLDCDTLPDSNDPMVCRKNPSQRGVCKDPREICLPYYNSSSLPNMLGDAIAKTLSFTMVEVIQNATDCYEHSMLFGCAVLEPKCSGKPYPNHYIPVCRSLCQNYIERCGMFLTFFGQGELANMNCSALPDSPDTNVCLGYAEAMQADVLVCAPGEQKCADSRCIKSFWKCDGYQDCDDNSDESTCASCPSNEMMCSPASSQCIPKEDGCNGIMDCYKGVDETYCVRMDKESKQDVLLVHNTYTTGWEEVCMEGWTNELAELTCRQLGYKKALTSAYLPATLGHLKARIVPRSNATDPDMLQSYLSKGHSSCPGSHVVRLLCMDSECGERPAYFKKATRIVGGEDVRPGTWPWMVSLHGGSKEKFFCGGTLIRDKWVLTAAHCIGAASNETAAQWTIKASQTRRLAFSDSVQVRKPKYLFPHPGFHSPTVVNDIALIELEKPFALNDFVRTICLAEAMPAPGKRCYATGWGKPSEKADRYESALKQVTVDIVSWDICKQALDSLPDNLVHYKLTKTMICAGGSRAHDACQGDSGGPLVFQTKNSTKWYQAGVVSWGVNCGYPNTPGVYTNVPLYTDWIHETIASSGE